MRSRRFKDMIERVVPFGQFDKHVDVSTTERKCLRRLLGSVASERIFWTCFLFTLVEREEASLTRARVTFMLDYYCKHSLCSF